MFANRAVTHENYFPTLDGWRAIAVSMVICSHFSHAYLKDSSHPYLKFLFKLFNIGGYGVDIFFAISGFLIASRVLQGIERKGSFDIKMFYVRRIFRILPAAFFYLIILLLMILPGWIYVHYLEFLSCLSFWRNYLTLSSLPESISFTSHYWSLSIEEHFYLFFPISIVLLKKSKNPKWFYLLAIVVVASWRIIDSRYSFFAYFHPHLKYNYQHSLVRFDGILWGVVFAFLYFSPKDRSRLEKFLLPPIVPLVMIISFGCLIIPLPGYRIWTAFFFALMIITTIINSTHFISKILETSLLRFMGRISYSLYLWQHLFVNGSQTVSPHWIRLLQTPYFNIVGMLAMAILSYYLIEKPLIYYSRRWQTKA